MRACPGVHLGLPCTLISKSFELLKPKFQTETAEMSQQWRVFPPKSISLLIYSAWNAVQCQGTDERRTPPPGQWCLFHGWDTQERLGMFGCFHDGEYNVVPLVSTPFWAFVNETRYRSLHLPSVELGFLSSSRMFHGKCYMSVCARVCVGGCACTHVSSKTSSCL